MEKTGKLECAGVKPKPCPFCGQAKRLPVYKWLGYIVDPPWTVYCDYDHGCGAIGPACDTKKEAIEKWNRPVRKGN